MRKGYIIFQLGYFCTFVVLFFWALLSVYGYSYDFETQEFTKGGVLTLQSSNAQYAQFQLGDAKPRRVDFPLTLHDVPLGMQTVTLERTGYHPWSTAVEVDDYYVTDLGNVLLRPIQQEVVTLPYEVDQCFYAKEYPQAFCVHHEKKLGYLVTLDTGRHFQVDILELAQAELRKVHWISATQLMLVGPAKTAPMVYQERTKQWQTLVLPQGKEEILENCSLTEDYGILTEEDGSTSRYYFLTGKTVPHAPEQATSHALILDRGQGVRVTSQDGYTLMREEGVHAQQLTRFGQRITAIEASAHPQYVHVATAKGWHLCHEQRHESCIFLTSHGEGSKVHPAHFVIFTQQEKTLHLVDTGLDLYGEKFPKLAIE